VGFAWDGVHILVNCAGIASFGPFHFSTDEAWRQIIAVNLLAPMQIVHQLLPTLIAAEEAHILNVCSYLGLVPWKKLSAYQASKYGLDLPSRCAMTITGTVSASRPCARDSSAPRC
jgi:short-subunit dehydrogenase